MKKDQLKKNVGDLVRLRPIPHWFDQQGQPLPDTDEAWRIETVDDAGVKISNPRSWHFRVLAYDNIGNYTEDRVVNGVRHGFLTLTVQLLIRGPTIDIEPTRPPGQQVASSVAPDPLRLAILRRLHQQPGHNVGRGDLPQFDGRAVIYEIARARDEGLIDAKILKDGSGAVEAVALRLTPAGVRWLNEHRHA